MSTTVEVFPRAGFRRRFGGWVYDLLVTIAIFMIAGYIFIITLIVLEHYNLVSIVKDQFGINWHETSVIYLILMQIWSIGWVAFFFIYFWAKSGQTLGMRAWRLRVQNQDGSLISKKTGLKRLLPTLLGLGNVLVIFDRKNKLSLQDRLTNTEVVLISLAANKGKDWVN